ncbi:hypothetical protein [Streptomyces sp. NPDC050145]|uniref:hypothetical protein n=1 Tax=Streptomyces sp. NPDC050145 TaxID=3365602 RepID=UPI0037BE1C8D
MTRTKKFLVTAAMIAGVAAGAATPAMADNHAGISPMGDNHTPVAPMGDNHSPIAPLDSHAG